MIERICHIDKELEDSIFLFGARQTGKSTFLRQKFPDSIYIDLLDTTIKGRFSRRPSLLYEDFRLWLSWKQTVDSFVRSYQQKDGRCRVYLYHWFFQKTLERRYMIICSTQSCLFNPNKILSSKREKSKQALTTDRLGFKLVDMSKRCKYRWFLVKNENFWKTVRLSGFLL